MFIGVEMGYSRILVLGTITRILYKMVLRSQSWKIKVEFSKYII